MEWKNLWVGNLGSDVSESDLSEVFSQYGGVESVCAYRSRSYAFVFFRRPQDAAAAKVGLSGFVLRGSPLKIEFARPAKPSTHLWVGGISGATSKEQLEREFLEFGSIVDLKFLRERNTAFIEFALLDDATRAAAEMNGKRVSGQPIRVDFLRSQPPNSNVLSVGYPSNFEIDEDMLHKAMILFGEIDNIESFPLRNYSLVEFRSSDEARRAKEGLQGRLFNDPRITIMYSETRPSRIISSSNWRGIIAKGGTPICTARCVPIGKWVGSDLPRVVNCSARTGLDMLTKHYADAIGFKALFFLPDSENDFASYTEFLRYLGAKNRAGVANLDDGTTLFLVPPSHFLTHVLKVAGPERLYGVVLKFPQPPINSPGPAYGWTQQHTEVPGTSEVDKDHRYQSTLQFAADLLLQIQHNKQ